MKKISLLILVFILFASLAFSQKGEGGYGFYFGYGLGKYTPGLGNLKSTMYLYDQQYGAKFKYKNNFNGPAFGARFIMQYWQVDLEWLYRHSKSESSYTD